MASRKVKLEAIFPCKYYKFFSNRAVNRHTIIPIPLIKGIPSLHGSVRGWTTYSTPTVQGNGGTPI
ncbi:MAG: hypothetical protein MJ115_05025, partial [Clostridia bacterium]|nr:hypothetical protein [Clostridia bacterium]